MKTLFGGIGLAVAVIAAPVLAQAPAGAPQRDQTRAEAQQRADMLFQLLDSNRDGTLTKAEAQQGMAEFQASRGTDAGHRGARMQRMIDEAFATSPSMTLQQFEAQALARFDAADLNHDGTLTAAERQQAREQRKGTPAPAPQPVPAKPQ